MKGPERFDMAGSSAFHCLSRCFSNCFGYKSRGSHQDRPLPNGFSNTDEKIEAKQGRNSFMSKKLVKSSIENGCCTQGRGRDDSLYAYEHVPFANEGTKKSFFNKENGLIIPYNGNGQDVTNLQPVSNLAKYDMNTELENNRNVMAVNSENGDSQDPQTTHNIQNTEHDTDLDSFIVGPGNTISLVFADEKAKISQVVTPDTSSINQKPDSEEEGPNTHINSGNRKDVIKTSDCAVPNIEGDVFHRSDSECVSDDATSVRLDGSNKSVVFSQAVDNTVPPIYSTTELNVNMKSKLFNEIDDLPSSVIIVSKDVEHVEDSSTNDSKLLGEHDIAYFRQTIQKERKRLCDLLTHWDKVLSGRSEMLEEAQDEIRSVIGQTHLVISERFVQFADLVDQSENYDSLSTDERAAMKPVTLSDLQGFWDMIYYQVEDVLMKFQRLEKAKDCNWKLEDLNKRKDFPSKKAVKITAARRNPAAKKVSSKVISPEEKARKEAARKRLAEARKKMAAQRQAQVDALVV